MHQDLRSVDRPAGPVPPPEVLERVPGDRDTLNQKPKAAGGPGAANGGTQ
jgi:hypothetical protein